MCRTHQTESGVIPSSFWGSCRGRNSLHWSHFAVSSRLCIIILVRFATHMGSHNINILGEGGNRLCQGMVLSTIGVTIILVLALALAVTAATTATFAAPSAATSTSLTISRSTTLADTALLERQ